MHLDWHIRSQPKIRAWAHTTVSDSDGLTFGTLLDGVLAENSTHYWFEGREWRCFEHEGTLRELVEAREAEMGKRAYIAGDIRIDLEYVVIPTGEEKRAVKMIAKKGGVPTFEED